jgi:heptosyltransferase-2
LEIINKLEKIKVLDFFIIFFLNKFFFIIRSSFRKKSKGNVVIVSLHKLGDTIFTIPAIKKIIASFSEQNVYVVTFPDSKELCNIVLEAEHVIPIEKNNFMLGGRIANRKARRLLKNLNPELIFDLTGSITSASLIAFSRANKIIGMNTKYCKTIYDHYVKIRQTPHLIDRYLDAANLYLPLNNEKISKEYPININVEDKILIHPFAGWKAKEWNLNKFVNLAVLLNKQYDIEIIATKNSVPSDIEQEILNLGLNLSFTASISDLINKIKLCSVFISNDSGPLYIANLLGKATFTIYGPTNPEFSLPFGKYHRYIQKKLECSPDGTQYCFTHAGLYCPANECMHQLSVSEVESSVLSFLREIELKTKIEK